MGQVIGFGITQYDWLDLVCVMREIRINIFSAEECLKSDNDISFNKNDTICAGIKAGGTDACQVSFFYYRFLWFEILDLSTEIAQICTLNIVSLH